MSSDIADQLRAGTVNINEGYAAALAEMEPVMAGKDVDKAREALKTAPGQCGCGIPDTDSDSDGKAICNDQCPSDATKTAAADGADR